MSRLEKMLAQEPRAEAASIEVPQSFVVFCTYVHVELTPGQRAFSLVAFDGADPADLTGLDRELALTIFGGVERFTAVSRGVVNAVCGGRGGKSYVLVALRHVQGMYVRDLSSLAPGQRAVSLVVAPREDLRQEIVNYALGCVRSHPGLRQTLRLPRGTKDDDVVSEFTVKRPDGQFVTFRGGVATQGGYGGRGKSLTDFSMDEAAFFRDTSFKVNDDEIYKAAAPRVLPGGLSLVASTPWAEAGLLHKNHETNFGHPVSCIAAHAPTTLLRPAAQEIVDRERARDPENAEREFDAKFMRGGTTLFFEPSLIASAVTDLPDVRVPEPGDLVAAGGDFGFRSDSSALVIVHRVGRVCVVGELLELRPQEGLPLKPSQTVKQFADRLIDHGCSYLMADGHYRESIDEHLVDAGLSFSDAPGVPADAYMRARVLFREGNVQIPNHPRLLQQLREVQGKPLPGGGMSIVQPRWSKGGHGDIVSALVLALYQVAGEETPAAKHEPGSNEWEEAQRRQRRGALASGKDRRKHGSRVA